MEFKSFHEMSASGSPAFGFETRLYHIDITIDCDRLLDFSILHLSFLKLIVFLLRHSMRRHCVPTSLKIGGLFVK